MTAQQLLDELLALQAEFGNLDNAPVCVFIMRHERLEISGIDHFTDLDPKTGKMTLHSIDLNARYFGEYYD